ncbi:MAG: N-acetylmuramoyl-L-alanine amidase [Desulfosoma sp.]|uniref:N-acetylmuramoyl-L-alanine amidase n=1 Tax=Desulfosoma sp. TaxID=2603217 RepID=UPI00404AEF60
MSSFVGSRACPATLLIGILVAAGLWGCASHQPLASSKPSPTPTPPSPTSSSTPTPPLGVSGPQRIQVIQEPLASQNKPRTVIHEVAPMETVWRLSKMYGVSMESIYRANRLKPGAPIVIGQKLIIPNATQFQNIIPLYPNGCWRYIVVHHTATDIGKATLIHSSHQNRGFWNGLGYHFLIDNGTLGKGDGQIEVSPRWIKQQKGAHCVAGGMNDVGIGVALVGNFNEGLPTPKQMQSLARLIRELTHYYRIPPKNILGHGDVPGANTDCPGKRFPWGELQRLLSSG